MRSATINLAYLKEVLVILISAVMFMGWSLLVPFDGAPDEIHHYEIISYIARHFRWPVFGPQGDVYIRDAPGTRDGKVFGFYALQPTYPYLLPALLLRIGGYDYRFGRFGSVLYGIITIYVLFRISCLLFPRLPILSHIIPIIAALIPQFSYIFSYMNQDSFGLMAIGLLFLSAIKLRLTSKPSLAMWLAVGGSWGLVAMARQHVWIFGTLMVLNIFVISESSKYIKRWIKLCCASIIPGFVILCWMLRNYLLYSDPMLWATARRAWETWLSTVAPYLLRPSFAFQGYSFVDFISLTDWKSETFKSFWAKFGYMNVEPPGQIYSIYIVLTSVFIILAVILIVISKNKDLICSIGLLIVLIFAHAYKNYTGDFQPQGRYLMIGYPIGFWIFGMIVQYLLSTFQSFKSIVLFAILFSICLLIVGYLLIFCCVIPKIPGIIPVEN